MQAPVKKSPWAKFGKGIHILVVLVFFLPFFGVSCDGMDVITVSGADMAAGCEPGGMATEANESRDVQELGGGMKIDKVKVEPLAIIALVAAIGGVVAAFLLKGRRAIQGSLVAAVLCLGCIVGLWIKVGGEIDHEIAKEMKEDMSKSSMMKDSKIESGTRMGLWLALASLSTLVALAGLALKDRETMPESVPPGGPGGSMA